MVKKNSISRRQFLKLSAYSFAGALLPTSLWKLNSPVNLNYKINPSITPTNSPIIANHSIVDQYSNIPQAYIDLVKMMWADLPGESHSAGYRVGCDLLEALDSRFQVNVTETGTPEAPTSQHLRISRATWGDVNNETGWIYGYGEEDWFTSTNAIQRTKAHLSYCNNNNLEIAAMGFGWCWDPCWHNPPGGGVDPAYQVRWAGSSVGGPEGDLRWGIDSDDQILTGNSVCMNTYLNAVQQYIEYCQTNNFPTKVFFTTGPVDSDYNIGESGYQRWLKHEHIRNHVLGSSDRILFDYADILCWNDTGQQQTTNWTDHNSTLRTFQIIHSDNAGNYAGHIGEAGCLRLGKALWWMLARIAGWDGVSNGDDDEPPSTPTGVNGVAVSYTQIDLTWNASIDNPGGTGIAGYRIYRNDEHVGTSINTGFSDVGLPPNLFYKYSVVAYDGAGNTSDPSSPIIVKTPNAPFSFFLPYLKG